MPIIKNARITKTQLGVEDHGIFSSWLFLEYDGGGSAFGGFALDGFDGVRRRGSAYGCEYIMTLLSTLDVGLWEQLSGTFCRVEMDGSYGKVVRVGHLLKEQWFDPTDRGLHVEG